MKPDLSVRSGGTRGYRLLYIHRPRSLIAYKASIYPQIREIRFVSASGGIQTVSGDLRTSPHELAHFFLPMQFCQYSVLGLFHKTFKSFQACSSYVVVFPLSEASLQIPPRRKLSQSVDDCANLRGTSPSFRDACLTTTIANTSESCDSDYSLNDCDGVFSVVTRITGITASQKIVRRKQKNVVR